MKINHYRYINGLVRYVRNGVFGCEEKKSGVVSERISQY